MTTRRWDERSDDADQVVIHISWVSQRLRACRHNRRDLNRQKPHSRSDDANQYIQITSPSLWGRGGGKTEVNHARVDWSGQTMASANAGGPH